MENPENVREIEITLYEQTSMLHMNYFQNLRTLSITAQRIQAIEGLSSAVHLESLWLCENELTAITGLESTTLLTRLYLCDNNITKMEGLGTLVNLQTLWLTENEIEVVEGLENLVELRQLYLSGNRIELIGTALDKLQRLEKLNLADNSIGSFREVLNLTRLSKLTNLCFSDPDFGENPICTLCNYQTYVLYHLSRLLHLDTLKVSEDAKIAAETTFMKKRMYYNMRIKTIQREVSKLISTLETYKNNKVKAIYEAISVLVEKSKYLEREIGERELLPKMLPEESLITFDGGPSNALNDMDPKSLQNSLEENMEILQESIKEKLDASTTLNTMFNRIKDKIHNLSSQNVHKLLTELDTGGNIRYEEGKETDNWFKSCVNLVDARFHPAQFSKYGINNVRVTKITRIHNRFLRNRFDDKLNQIADVSTNAYKKSLEYLFYGVDPAAPHEIFHNMEEGFRTPNENASLGLPPCSIVVNTLELADLGRIKSLNSRLQEADIGLDIPSGLVLVCKTYIGSNVSDPTRSLYYPDMSIGEIWDEDPVNFETGNAFYRTKSDDDKQRVWFLTDSTLILPEYLVEFEYTNEDPSEELDVIQQELEVPYKDFKAAELGSLQSTINWYWGQSARITSNNTADDLPPMEPQLPTRSKIDSISDKVIEFFARTSSYASIKYLNLSFNNLVSMEGLHDLTGLNTIILAGNQIEVLDNLEKNVKLTRIDASYNKIKAVGNIENNVALENLDLFQNNISSFGTIFQLSMECNTLINLNLSWNPIARSLRYRTKVIKQIATLQILDSIVVNESEQQEVAQYSTSLITKDMIRENASVGNKSTKSLLAPSSYSRNNPGTRSLEIAGEDWEQNVEILDLNHKKITSLHGLQNLFNLRKAYFIDNEIEAVAGLHNCRLLEELSLEGNCLTAIEGVAHLIYLKKLDLGKNYIRKIENLGSLEYLTQLSLEDNQIDSLEGLGNLRNLMELYLGNNRLNNKKEIQLLQDHPKLIILDLSNNAMSKEKGFRTFTIFNLSRLKVLDGLGIEQTERSQAKSQFQGRLTEDILEKRLKGLTKSEIKTLDLSKTKLKDFDDTFNRVTYASLTELVLTENNISSFKCFGQLPTLKVLHLSKNQIEIFCPRDLDLSRGLGGLPALEVLDISYNRLQEFTGIQAYTLKNLTTLRASHNSIVRVDFLFNLPQLRELDVGSNKIREVAQSAFGPRCPLRCLCLDDNALRSLSGLNKLAQLQVLYASGNRMTEIFEVEKLVELVYLAELVLKGNPMSRKPMYRTGIIKKMQQLLYLDDVEITPEERDKLDYIPMASEKAPPLVHLAQMPNNQKTPVRLTSLNFDAVLPARSVEREQYSQAMQEKNRRPSSTVNQNTLVNQIGVTSLTNQKRPPKTKVVEVKGSFAGGFSNSGTGNNGKHSSHSNSPKSAPQYRR